MDNEKSRLPFRWFETWQPETPEKENLIKLTFNCINAPLEYVIIPQGIPWNMFYRRVSYFKLFL